MRYKLICIDLDGTLLNSRLQISEANKAGLRKAYENGVYIVISTGRTYSDAQYYAGLIGVRASIIAANGAYIFDEKRQSPIYQRVLGENLSLKILDICNQYHVSPIFHTPQKEYYGSTLFVVLWRMFGLKSRIKRKIKGVERRYIIGYQQWRKVIAMEKDYIVKCVIFHINKEKIRKIRNEFERIKELEVTSSGLTNIELNYRGTSKGKGVEMLARGYNLAKEEVIAIGDSENDLSMIEYAGLGVAMGNAAEIVKDKADYITDTNEHDGVAKVINEFVLNSLSD